MDVKNMTNKNILGLLEYLQRTIEAITRDYAPSIDSSIPTRFWSLFSPNNISQTILFSKPNFLVEAMIAQIGAESQFYPDFGSVSV